MVDTIKVFNEPAVGQHRVGAPPTKQDTLVGEASTQTLTDKTLTDPVVTINIGDDLAATGASGGDAAAITMPSFSVVHVTAADATKGVKLPAAAAGLIYLIKNANAANAILKVYPNTGDKINAGSAGSSISMAAKTCAWFVARDATDWETSPLLPS